MSEGMSRTSLRVFEYPARAQSQTHTRLAFDLATRILRNKTDGESHTKDPPWSPVTGPRKE